MQETRGFVEDLALVLCVAAITTVLCRKLRQPVVLGYLLAGLIVGPYIPVPLFADADRVHTLSELGVILVMFALGLEFSFRKLIQLAPTSGLIALFQIAVLMWLGYVIGQSFNWTVTESFFTGAMIAISSTMIIAKAFEEKGIRGKVKDIVVGVLIFEDIAAVLLIAMLTAFSTGGGMSSGSVLSGAAFRLLAFLAIFVALGFLIVPRSIRAVARFRSRETLLIASVGLCFGFSYLAQKVGYSVALGAFIAGALVAESGHASQIEHLIKSVRDLFASIFFISVGMLMDPAVVMEHWAAVVVLSVVVVVGKMISVSLGTFLTGNSVRTSVQSGMSMAQIGEFSFIIAGVGLASGAIREFLYPIGIAVSVITTFTTPSLITISARAASKVDQWLPENLQTFTTLYGSWIERLRHPSQPGSRTRRLVWLLLIDVFLLIALIIGTAKGRPALTELVMRLAGFSEQITQWVIASLVCIVGIPLTVGAVRSARALGTTLATSALPEGETGKVDMAEAPRNLLVLTLQLAVVIAVTLVIIAATQPFLPSIPLAGILLIILGVAALLFWQRAVNLQGHVRAGAEVIIEALSRQSSEHPSRGETEVLIQLQTLLPGLGKMHPVELKDSHDAIGRTLGDLNIHSLTGATVIAIVRQPHGVVVPSGTEKLQTGDVLALIGTEEAVEHARKILSQHGE